MRHSFEQIRNQVTGDSTYYTGAPLALQEYGTIAGGAEGQQYSGSMVEGSGAEYASSGDWAKYYDVDYACDYYHNFRQGYRENPLLSSRPRPEACCLYLSSACNYTPGG